MEKYTYIVTVEITDKVSKELIRTYIDTALEEYLNFFYAKIKVENSPIVRVE